MGIKNLIVNNDTLKKTAFYGASLVLPFGLVCTLTGDIPFIRQNEKKYGWTITNFDEEGILSINEAPGSILKEEDVYSRSTSITITDRWKAVVGEDDNTEYHRDTNTYLFDYARNELTNYSIDDIELLKEELGKPTEVNTEVRKSVSDDEMNEGSKMSYTICDKADYYQLIPQSEADNAIGSMFYILLSGTCLLGTNLILEDKEKKLVK